MLLPPGGGAGLIDATSKVGVTAGCADAMLDATAIRPATTIIGFIGRSQLLTRCLRETLRTHIRRARGGSSKSCLISPSARAGSIPPPVPDPGYMPGC